MNWEMVGALGEVLGGVAVIGTLLYLARQVHHSVEEALEARLETLVTVVAEMHGQTAASPDLASLWVRGMEGEEELTPEETVRFAALMLRMCTVWQQAHDLERNYDMDPGQFEGVRRARREIVGAPGFQRFFRRRRHWFNESFQREIEADMSAGLSYSLDSTDPGSGAHSTGSRG